jgi:hypothetical protein
MKAFWTQLRILFIELLVGTALGVLVWELVGRRLLALKYGSLGGTITCAPDVERALADFDGGLRTAAALGAVGFVALTLFFRLVLWRHKRHGQAGSKPATS